MRTPEQQRDDEIQAAQRAIDYRNYQAYLNSSQPRRTLAEERDAEIRASQRTIDFRNFQTQLRIDAELKR